jgi:hypothetical protein
MKKIILIFSICISVFVGFSQSFNINNDDSCKIFLCKKIWISHHLDIPNQKLYGSGDTIRFYTNGTFIKGKGTKPEQKGKWKWDGLPQSNSGTLYCYRNISITVTTKKAIESLGFVLVDGKIACSEQKKLTAYCPTNIPYLDNSNNKNTGTVYTQEYPVPPPAVSKPVTLIISDTSNCKIFLCSKEWVMEYYSKLYRRNLEYDKITFYKNGTYIKQKPRVTNEADMAGEEKGIWKLDTLDSTGRIIIVTSKTVSGIDSYKLKLEDGQLPHIICLGCKGNEDFIQK